MHFILVFGINSTFKKNQITFKSYTFLLLKYVQYIKLVFTLVSSWRTNIVFYNNCK